MDGPRECYTEWSKSEKEKYPLYVESKKKQYNWTYKTTRLQGLAYGSQGEGWGKGLVREFGMDMYTLLYWKWINQQGPTV